MKNKTLKIAVLAASMSLIASAAYAASTSNFTQVITAGTLATDIVDASYVTVGSPAVAMASQTFDFSCQTSTGTFGTDTERVYVSNPDAADDGWDLTLAASAASDVWDSAGTDFDFNDPTGSGCTDGADAGDTVGGQLTVDATTSSSLSAGNCSSCGTSNISTGASTAFSEGVTDSVTILDAAAGSDDIGDWYIIDIDLSQEIPAEQPVAADYDIDMVLTVAAK